MCFNQGNELTLIISTVSVNCKDTRIAVQVRTNKPFNGRIYALGRSETCNIDVVSSDLFRLDLTMTGQDCNTQSVVSIMLFYKSLNKCLVAGLIIKHCFISMSCTKFLWARSPYLVSYYLFVIYLYTWDWNIKFSRKRLNFSYNQTIWIILLVSASPPPWMGGSMVIFSCGRQHFLN